jgi:hypothetical protein
MIMRPLRVPGESMDELQPCSICGSLRWWFDGEAWRYWRCEHKLPSPLVRRWYPCLIDSNRVCLTFRSRCPVSLLARTGPGLLTNEKARSPFRAVP